MLLPVQMHLRVGRDGPSCWFTTNLPFAVVPTVKHRLFIRRQDGDQVHCWAVEVVDVCHFITVEKDETCLVTAAPVMLDSYDDLIVLLDWFKAIYQIEEVTGTVEPEPYYKLYRSVLHVLGLTKHPYPIVAHDPDDIKVFAEAFRSVVLAELPDGHGRDLSDLMMSAHQLVHARRVVEPDGARMLGVVKKLEHEARRELGDLRWDAPPEKCLDVASVVFAKLRSIPSEKLPEPLRNR